MKFVAMKTAGSQRSSKHKEEVPFELVCKHHCSEATLQREAQEARKEVEEWRRQKALKAWQRHLNDEEAQQRRKQKDQMQEAAKEDSSRPKVLLKEKIWPMSKDGLCVEDCQVPCVQTCVISEAHSTKNCRCRAHQARLPVKRLGKSQAR